MSASSIFRFILYLVPITLVLGTNYDLFAIGGRVLNLGHFDVLVVLLFIFSFFLPSKTEIPKQLFIIFFILSIVIALSIILEIYYSHTIPEASVLIQVIRWFEYAIVFYLLFSYIENERDIKTIVYVSLACSILFVLVAAQQAATFNFFEKRVYGLFQSAADRAGDSVPNPNVAGTYLMGCCIFYLSFAQSTKGNIQKIALYLLFAVAFFTMIMTLSRSSFLGFMLGVIALLFYNKVKTYKIILGIAAIIITLLIAVNNIEILKYRIDVTFDTSAEEYVSISDRKERSWIALIEGFQNFWFGTGYADFERHYGFLTPDNFYAETFSDIGFFGLFSFLIFVGVIFVEISKNIKTTEDPFFRSLTIGFMSFFFAFLLANYTGNLFRNPRLLGLFFLFTALTYKYHIIKLKKV